MNALRTALKGAPAIDRTSYRARLFRLPADAHALEELLAGTEAVEVHDHLLGQLKELVRSLNPSVRYTPEELESAALAHLGGTDPLQYGVWAYFPWSRRLVHLLDEPEFALVRTDRNRNKITREEQAVLATKRVGVIGLSVGQSVSLTMALERSFGEIRLADFDELELSNLNRIRCGVHEMGIHKVINTAREIAELDPFLKVTCFTEGITRANIERFLTEGGRLDVLVEECDSVDVKIYARQHAKALGIPVVMDTSDRGLIDVERYDLEPERPLLHGLLEGLDLAQVERPMTNQEKLPFMGRIVGMETISKRMQESLPELGRTIVTWPQLASGVVLGGSIVGETTRRMMLDQMRHSGRWWIDTEAHLSQTSSDIQKP
ncbi:MAG: ThiF family adenylyltransferase [Flavobacteriales bacterium]